MEKAKMYIVTLGSGETIEIISEASAVLNPTEDEKG